MQARRPRDLPRGLGHAVVGGDAATQVDDAHQQEQERDEDQRELDEGLPARALIAAGSQEAHGRTVMRTAPVVSSPAAFVTVSVTS
jgi:hypothetical protein